MVKTYTTELAGRPLVMEFGKYCGQANGSVIVRLGDTVVMVNATASDTPREGQDFFPLSVDFEEKMYSVGKIPGGFIKREGRPSEKATLTSRLIDCARCSTRACATTCRLWRRCFPLSRTCRRIFPR